MSLVTAMKVASRIRKRLRIGKKPTSKGLKGGMWAKKSAINKAYGLSANMKAFEWGVKSGATNKKPPFGKAYALGLKARGQAQGAFAKRYPKTQFAMNTGKVAGIGALGAWILNDDDKKA
jgi:hypothetical protein|tara:strand:+ start:99 stop:458 length:360 start_codon:yes stop_codon:yes gene_type:complete